MALLICKFVGTENWNQTDEIALPRRELLIEGLKSDAAYWLIGVARENERRTDSARYKIHTAGGIGLSYLNAGEAIKKQREEAPIATLSISEHLREAAWFIAILVVIGIILLILALFCCIAHCRSGKYSVQKREEQWGKQNEASEYSKFLEYHHLNERDDPPTISVFACRLDDRRKASAA